MSNKTLKAEDEKTALAPRTPLLKFLFYISLFVAVILASAYLISAKDAPDTPEHSYLVSKKCLRMDGDSKCLAILEVADTDAKRIKGLSGREHMAKDHGMIFTSDVVETQCFWMKGMMFPLDFIWLDSDKKIVKIDHNVSPSTYPKQYCVGNVRYVVELNGGYVTKVELDSGQKLDF